MNHLSYYHRDKEADKVRYRLNLLYTFSKAMEREGVEVDIIMNSKLDHYLLAMSSMVMKRGVAEVGHLQPT